MNDAIELIRTMLNVKLMINIDQCTRLMQGRTNFQNVSRYRKERAKVDKTEEKGTREDQFVETTKKKRDSTERENRKFTFFSNQFFSVTAPEFRSISGANYLPLRSFSIGKERKREGKIQRVNRPLSQKYFRPRNRIVIEHECITRATILANAFRSFQFVKQQITKYVHDSPPFSCQQLTECVHYAPIFP